MEVKELIFNKQCGKPPLWKDIKHIDFKDEDEIRCEYVEAYYSEDNSYDAHFMIEVYRKRDETPEEILKRVQDHAKQAKYLKDRRRETFLKLKEEFSNEIL